MISLNGYSTSNLPFSYDKWQPIIDTYNDWLQLGDIRIGQLHCQNHGCPSWGENNGYGKFKEEVGIVCLGYYYWNPSYTSCISCMNTCSICVNGSSCIQYCYEVISNCDQCNSSSCTKCQNGYYLQPGNMSCLTTCPSPTYIKSDSPVQGVCKICGDAYSNCQTCNLTMCLTCKSGIGVYYQPSTPTCLSSCPSTYHKKETPSPFC
jgi:hypothetical protein